ncbi:MAG: hypothetical protein GEV07_02805 [Streptosporangiales bacterium]|nr:hypothetical protein [Streptosporangiales bacterium]
MSALSDVVEILSTTIKDVESGQANATQAETSAGEALTAATAYGNQSNIAQTEQLKATIEEASGLLVQAKDKLDEALGQAQALEQG